MFQAAGTIHIPETVPHQILDFPVFILFLQPYNQIIIMTDLRNIYVNLSSNDDLIADLKNVTFEEAESKPAVTGNIIK